MMNEKAKEKLVWLGIFAVVAIVVLLSVWALLSSAEMQGTFSHEIKYDAADFPSEYEIDHMRTALLGTLCLSKEESLGMPLSVASTLKITENTAGDKMVCNVDFVCREKETELFFGVPDHLVFAELADPIEADINKAFAAKAGKITEIPVYDGGELIYTLSVCWNETFYDTMPSGSIDFAVLVTPESGQEYNVEGIIANQAIGNESGTEYETRTALNIILNRIYVNGIMNDGGMDREKARCEELLGIDADKLSDDHGLFLQTLSPSEFGGNKVFRIDAFVKRVPAYTGIVDPHDYVTK